MGISSDNLVKISTEGIIFREVKTSDLKDIVRIEKLSFPDPWTPSQLLFEIVHEYSRGIVAEICGKVAGYIFGMVVGDEGHIGNIAVDPGFRRRGIGKKLLQLMLEDMEQSGVKMVFLEVRKSNEAARKLYLSAGFVEVGLRRRYYRNGEDAIVMMKELGK